MLGEQRTTLNCTWDAVNALFAPPDRAAATGYTFKARLMAGAPVIAPTPLALGNTTQFVNPGTPNGTFILSVAGTNGALEGPESNIQTVTIPAGGGPPGCTTAPNTPTGFGATFPMPNTVKLDWKDGGGCPATSYLIAVGGAPVATTTNTTFTVPGVASGTYPGVTVAALNAFGPSAPSAPITVVVP